MFLTILQQIAALRHYVLAKSELTLLITLTSQFFWFFFVHPFILVHPLKNLIHSRLNRSFF